MKRLIVLLAIIAFVQAMTVTSRAQPAPATDRFDFKKAREFWAFQPVKDFPAPAVKDATWAKTAIDQFILAALEKQGLRPSPPATKLELIRRAYFDVTGLPPTPEEIKAFVDDTSPDAYEKLVDRLLESPHFGEHWAQHWQDVVRYAESEGFEYDKHLPDAWRYRDYVIDAINKDKPFNQFVTEQIAGDEIAPENLECQTAAIFHRLGAVRRNAGNADVAASRNEVLIERTDVIGAAFLGLTVGCARCHDHKFDPILQKDYYRLQAYMAATAENDMIQASAEERQDYQRKTAAINSQLRRLRTAVDRAQGDERVKLKEEVEALEDSLPPSPATIPGIKDDFKNITEIHVLKRGEWEKKGDLVAPRPLSVLVADDTPELAADAPKPRAQLAQWLTDPANPLPARVIVNRLWQDHFGLGIVKTANNFGINGERPTHPELLDFLASRLVEGGWKLKPLHRMILLSSTYRQSSQSPIVELGMKTDPEDRLLWRFERRRLSAEEIRDSMLATSGKLNLKVGGPSVMVPVDKELVQLLYKPAQWQVANRPEEHDRRSIYLIAKRNLRLPFMETFDQPALQTSCARRESSTHAPQALEMLNGALANQQATAFAERLEKEADGNTDQLISRGYWLALGREPTAKERELSAAFLHDQSPKEFALALFNLNGFFYVQ